MTAVFIMFVAVLLQCGAQAASVGPRRNINATKLSGCCIRPALLHSFRSVACPLCCIRRDNACEKMSADLKKLLTDTSLIVVFDLNPQLHLSRGRMAEQRFRFECYAMLLEPT